MTALGDPVTPDLSSAVGRILTQFTQAPWKRQNIFTSFEITVGYKNEVPLYLLNPLHQVLSFSSIYSHVSQFHSLSSVPDLKIGDPPGPTSGTNDFHYFPVSSLSKTLPKWCLVSGIVSAGLFCAGGVFGGSSCSADAADRSREWRCNWSRM